MYRGILFGAASIALYTLSTEDLKLGQFLPLSNDQIKTLVRYLKWGLPLFAVADINSTLNRWAERKWIWREDKSGWKWEHEIAVVTGGSGGIGACVVKQLVEHKIKVAVLDVQPLSDVFTKDELTLIRFYKCDVTSRDDVHVVGEAIRSDLGPPSILINNAGVGNGATILEVSQEKLKRLFDINIISHWSTVQEFLPDMLVKKKGHIMGVASLASFVTLAGAADYSCTKAALLSFHEALALELKYRHKCPQIKSSIVHPGWTRSALTTNPSVAPGLKRARAKLLEPEDVAKAMVTQIIEAKSGQIVLGPSIVTRVRALPLWLQEVIRDSAANIVSARGSTA